MAEMNTWHEIDLSSRDEEDPELPEIAAGPSIYSNGWPLGSSTQVQPDPLSSPIPAPAAATIATPFPHRDAAATASRFSSFWRRNKHCFVSLLLILITSVIAFSASFTVAYHIDIHLSESQWDSTPANASSTPIPAVCSGSEEYKLAIEVKEKSLMNPRSLGKSKELDKAAGGDCIEYLDGIASNAAIHQGYAALN
ncbi:uncharacterized protein LY89DRAFT_664446 [Mollisia scopiformis]|uniref:Uncharacterized protein n=1 Tax=Mollisia scopiformis TaxID=149040 RepID=A0A194XR34_MOLSC|nr:uncharacterized protein LY89DRAFT_664446 [Mollisia scopiformis]KUJ22648.1 hypothetical protein LY89DRAFT_664446 [Mollisia scopiformis]